VTPATRAAIFDLDGVLVDTEPLYTLATQEVVAPYGKTYDWSLKAHCMGNSALVSARLITERLELPLSAEAFLELREPIIERMFASVPEITGATLLLDSLTRLGFALGLATSSSRRLLELKTGHHRFMAHFSTVVCGDDEELARPKPAPDIFLLAARRLGVPAQRCVVFEDSPAGVRAGVAAGMRVIARRDPQLDPSLLSGAERIISHFSELDPRELTFAEA
jgi:pseudouridine 5'-phosphatase